MAATGIILELLQKDKKRIIPLMLYIVMGWLIVVAIRPLLSALPFSAFIWLLAGGLLYTGGIVFYALDRAYSHGIWHLFVLAGSMSHFISIYFYVL